MHKISVIVPIYNPGKYLETCLCSLFEQTLDDIDYIFVDDCSNDSSIDVLKNIMMRYPDRKASVSLVRNAHNMGPSASRNEGLKQSSGKYVIFCDADDVVEKDAYELMYYEAEREEADVVSCGVFADSFDTSTPVLFENIATLSLNDVYMLEGVLYSSLWNKLIRKDLLTNHNISFSPSLIMWDDLYFTYLVRFYSRKNIILNKPLYHYRNCNGESITSQDAFKKSQSQIACAKLLEKFINDTNSDNADYVINFLKLRSKDLLFCSEHIEKWLQIYPETHRVIYQYVKFYGIARTIRFYIVVLAGKLGWTILNTYSVIKRKIKSKCK